ncbi:MAG: hypothetical protein KC621_09390 [Myxococcales bacterium]|nr:hypothetical protein [Myxococcales bacterium]
MASDALQRVTARLDERGIAYRLIGAAALAVHGVSRSTRDLDLLVADEAVLDPELWAGVAPSGYLLEVRRGDATDPLTGVVRLEEELSDDTGWDTTPDLIDVVVLTGPWARRAVSGDGPATEIGAVTLRAVDAVNLVLLKLYAGSARDGWDVAALLEAVDEPDPLIAGVEAGLSSLPERCRRLWDRLR